MIKPGSRVIIGKHITGTVKYKMGQYIEVKGDDGFTYTVPIKNCKEEPSKPSYSPKDK